MVIAPPTTKVVGVCEAFTPSADVQHTDPCSCKPQYGVIFVSYNNCYALQVKSLALAETEAAAVILGKAERLIKSLAQQREQQRERERQAAAAGAASTNQETALRAQMADLQVRVIVRVWNNDKGLLQGVGEQHSAMPPLAEAAQEHTLLSTSGGTCSRYSCWSVI